MSARARGRRCSRRRAAWNPPNPAPTTMTRAGFDMTTPWKLGTMLRGWRAGNSRRIRGDTGPVTGRSPPRCGSPPHDRRDRAEPGGSAGLRDEWGGPEVARLLDLVGDERCEVRPGDRAPAR